MMSAVKINVDDTFRNKLNKKIIELNEQKLIDRIWKKDFTVWNEEPTEISNRLGWLDCPETTSKSIDEINQFVDEIKRAGFTHALLLGMGGSSLAPEVFRKTFGVKAGYLDLEVLDSTHPEAVLEFRDKLDPEKTLYIVSTKSGGTIETISLMKYFYNFVFNTLGKEKAGNQFIAITDPGSGLEQMANDLKFRKIFLNDPNIGGRFSALSLFGIVPAALLGVNIAKFLSMGKKAEVESREKLVDLNSANTSALLGLLIGEFYKAGKDKMTIVLSNKLRSLGLWMEQLIAESTGKNGKGILPIDGEDLLEPETYGSDRYFVSLRLKGENENSELQKIVNSGLPVVEIEMENEYDLAGQFFIWEFATSLASALMSIHPFDQPDVESAKIRAREMIKEFEEKGDLPKLTPNLIDDKVSVYGDIKSTNLKDALHVFISSAKSKGYLSIQAFLKPEETTLAQLQKFRTKIQKKYKIATTVGFGPRFLHSTGQLHKGDAGNGIFIQIVSGQKADTPIPASATSDKSEFSFGTLIDAQALGDRQALVDKGRKVMRIELDNDEEFKSLI